MSTESYQSAKPALLVPQGALKLLHLLVSWPESFVDLTSFIYFLKLIYFNWRIITLEYCDGFSIHRHASVTGARVPQSWPFCPHTIPLDCPGAGTATVFLSTQLRQQPLVGVPSFLSLEVGQSEGRKASCRLWCHSHWNKKVVVVKKSMWKLKCGWFSRSFYV